MDGVLQSIHKIRKLKEREERLDLVRAEAEERRREERLQGTCSSIDRARQGADAGDVHDVSRAHAWTLRMEMVRRRDEESVRLAQREVVARRERVRAAATDARVIERVAEVRAEARAQVQAASAISQLDEIGLQGWWRRSA